MYGLQDGLVFVKYQSSPNNCKANGFQRSLQCLGDRSQGYTDVTLLRVLWFYKSFFFFLNFVGQQRGVWYENKPFVSKDQSFLLNSLFWDEKQKRSGFCSALVTLLFLGFRSEQFLLLSFLEYLLQYYTVFIILSLQTVQAVSGFIGKQLVSQASAVAVSGAETTGLS